MMGIVSDSDLEKELLRNSNSPVLRPDIGRGRKEGDVNVPDSLRKLIASDAISNGNESALSLAKSVGVSASSVSAYKNGSTSTTSYNERDKDLNTHNNGVREKIAGRARSKLLLALRNITPDKIKSAKLKDVASVARDMAAVVRQMEPKDASPEAATSKVSINIFAPARKLEADYDIIEVSE